MAEMILAPLKLATGAVGDIVKAGTNVKECRDNSKDLRHQQEIRNDTLAMDREEHGVRLETEVIRNEREKNLLKISNIELQKMKEQTDKNVILIKAVNEEDIGTLTQLLKCVTLIDPATLNIAQDIAQKKNNEYVIKLLENIEERKSSRVLEVIGSYSEKQQPSLSKCSSMLDETDSYSEKQQPSSSLEDDITQDTLIKINAAMGDPEQLFTVLDHLTDNIELVDASNYQEIVKVLLPCLDKYQEAVSVVSLGLFAFGRILSSPVKDQQQHLSHRLQTRVIDITLTSLEKHSDHPAVVECALRILLTCEKPVLLSKCRQVTTAALKLFKRYAKDDSDKAIWSLYVLDNMVHGSTEIKETMASAGVMQDIFSYTEKRLKKKEFNDKLEFSWRIIWNILNGTKENCKLFIKLDGHSYFLRCFKKFPNNGVLLRNIMGALGNTMECSELRSVLIKSTVVEAAYKLLESKMEDYGVSCEAGQLLCWLASEGPKAWRIKSPSRQQVLDRLAAVIEKWDPEVDFGVRVSTFKEELKVLQDFSTPELQHFVLWMISYYIKQDAEKYCTMLEEEGGLPILEKVMYSSLPYARVKELSKTVYKQYQQIKNKLQ